jgi:hypothetical protein
VSVELEIHSIESTYTGGLNRNKHNGSKVPRSSGGDRAANFIQLSTYVSEQVTDRWRDEAEPQVMASLENDDVSKEWVGCAYQMQCVL